nr:DNA-directed RNA polymerase III subunit rpc3 isoform X2 [Nicotiana tomentosiformis]
MVSPHGIKLAVYLISSYFGDLNAKVCECLLQRGTQSLAQIVRFTELSRENVRNCLLVLIHHNCVQAFAVQQEGAFGEAPKVITNYMALFDNIIHKLRFPKFLEIVSEVLGEKVGKEVGKECEEIFEGLLQHGRLSLNQIIDRFKQTSNQGDSSAEAARDNFNKLVNARFVERCPAPEPFLGPSAEEETAAKKQGAKSAKIVKQTIEQRALAAAAPMESMRFLVETDTWNEASVETTDKKTTVVTLGTKRKQDNLESNTELLATDENKVLWRANFEEFIRRLRHKACVANVKVRVNNDAAIVLAATLELSRHSETKVRIDNSVPQSINAIYDEVIKRDGGLGMDLERIRASLVELGCETPLMAIDETYSVDLKNVIEQARIEEVESIVLKRYGREAYRMFRLLSKADRLLETDKISDTTFVEKKDAVKILFKLWKDDYLEMKKVIARGARQSEFILWKINKQSLWEHVLDEMYHAALNLRLRITHEQEQEKEILQMPREKLVKELHSELHNRYNRLRKVRITLESSLMNLDDALMLFRDF